MKMGFSKRQLKTYARGKRVLLVDDNRQTRTILKSLLREYFPFIMAARNGKDGLKAYSKYKFDIVITDVMMPIMDGIEMSKEIKKIDSDQSILVISSDENLNDIIELIDIGIDSFIRKPIDANTVCTKILKILEHQFFKDEINRFEHEQTINEYIKAKNISSSSTKSTISQVKKDEIVKGVLESKNCPASLSEYSAIEFMRKAEKEYKDLDKVVENLLIYIEDLEDNISILLVQGIRPDTLNNLSSLFSKIYNEVSTFKELTSIADKIFEIHDFFMEYSNTSTLTPDQQEVFDFSQYILEDIKSFVLHVFIAPSYQDIRVYEKMLGNSLEQIMLKINGAEALDDDIEFF
jgi:DNA-binding response OmpR family regulator